MFKSLLSSQIHISPLDNRSSRAPHLFWLNPDLLPLKTPSRLYTQWEEVGPPTKTVWVPLKQLNK